jgi:hypothetical protein
MKHLIAAAAALFFVIAGAAGAANPSGTGQPSQTCLTSTTPSEPGNAANAPGSAFTENCGTAGGVYAGSGQTLNTPANSYAVSQYDVACFQVSQHH